MSCSAIVSKNVEMIAERTSVTHDSSRVGLVGANAMVPGLQISTDVCIQILLTVTVSGTHQPRARRSDSKSNINCKIKLRIDSRIKIQFANWISCESDRPTCDNVTLLPTKLDSQSGGRLLLYWDVGHFVPWTLRTFRTLRTVTKLVTSYRGWGTKWPIWLRYKVSRRYEVSRVNPRPRHFVPLLKYVFLNNLMSVEIKIIS